MRLRDRISDEAQALRAVTRRNIGSPQLSRNGIDTLDKIIETVFMALLATTIGTLLAIPVSFFAAQNLMRTVTSPFTSVGLSVIAAPIGALLGILLARWLGALSSQMGSTLAVNVGGTVVLPVVVWALVRAATPVETPGTATPRPPWRMTILLLLATVIVILVGYFLADLALIVGNTLARNLGDWGFLGGFLADLGGILRLTIPALCALIGLGVLVNGAGQVGQRLVERAGPSTGKLINLVVGALAGATLAALLGAAIAWFYELRNLTTTLFWPALVGAIGGVLLALRVRYNASLPVGLVLYSITRTVLNALRSIEALIMVIVFAVWVGIGPFAGVLALGLHTVAALAKLYSEQVESIAHGPLEAILATGANRLQMIVYAVIPQIIPPYISFTMYRWDINVRMSTIIGFAGGGGIGFLLQQNINLLNYRAASAQIVAIAVVVSLMDYLSSALRQRAI
ncbi:MAG: ABC transporter permease subunit [Caldilineaceae bacterium]